MTSIDGVSSNLLISSVAQEILKTSDANSDGKVSTTEFSDMLQKLLSSSSSIDTSKLIAKIDTNGDGEISKDELIAFMEGNKPRHAPPPPPHGARMDVEMIKDLVSSSTSISASDKDAITSLISKITAYKKDNNIDSIMESLKSGTELTSDQQKILDTLRSYQEQLMASVKTILDKTATVSATSSTGTSSTVTSAAVSKTTSTASTTV